MIISKDCFRPVTVLTPLLAEIEWATGMFDVFTIGCYAIMLDLACTLMLILMN